MSHIAQRFVQDPVRLVREWNLTQLQLQPGLRLDEKFSVLYKPDLDRKGRVTVVSGGGSGHEPAHSGYVGEGMLDIAVTGALFASPNVRQIQRGLELAACPKGTILVVKNYTGDKLNFALAAEQFKGATGNDVRMVLVGDDVAVGRTRGKFVGRRGLTGTAIMHKVAGAAAERGFELDRIVQLCDKIITPKMGTIGVSLAPCVVPGQSANTAVHSNEIKLGMGIHNEPPISSLPQNTPVEEVIRQMLDLLLNPNNEEHAFLGGDATDPNRRVICLINNLGGLSCLEAGALSSIVAGQLKSTYNIIPCRTFCGTFLSALDGRGFSITILSLDGSEDASTVLDLLDAPTTAIGWSPSIPSSQWSLQLSSTTDSPISPQPVVRQTAINVPCDPNMFENIIEGIFDEVSIQEPTITQYDVMLGDGDCGTTLLSGASAIRNALVEGLINPGDLSLGMLALAEVVTNAMGGTSGAIYGIFLSAFAASLSQSFVETEGITVQYFSRALSHSLESLMRFTGARVGDRTLMDALIPFVGEFERSAKSMRGIAATKAATAAAVAGCEATRHLEARFGRSTYVNDEQGLENATGETTRLPDPGACGIVAVLDGIIKGISS
ncbi:dihydroxyacetone kinase 2 [Penicillium malachiteum]|nr:dihydroxyacetone kinase 2 [Penicillium malachiteum]